MPNIKKVSDIKSALSDLLLPQTLRFRLQYLQNYKVCWY